MDTNALLRQLPSVDEALKYAPLHKLSEIHGHRIVADAIRDCLEATRLAIIEATLPFVEKVAIFADMEIRVDEVVKAGLRPVINATGVVLHTNLGRSPLAERAVRRVQDVISNYNTLEYDLRLGGRGQRTSHLEAILQKLTGAEAAVAVNNNAAAVLLILQTLCRDQEVIVSRGELIEIGGAFRIPDVMTASGATLKEVGTTNKTHLSDYRNAIGEKTGAIMKVHTSNYRIVGYTEAVAIDELYPLAAQQDIPLIHNLGSGTFVDLSPFGIHDEPTVRQAVAGGADLVSFSGDKLLGGAQAGIVVGKKKYIDQLKKAPLMRALRLDKMTIAALEETLTLYLDDATAWAEIPILAMLATPVAKIQERSERFVARLREAKIEASVEATKAVMGGGSTPTKVFDSYGIAIAPTARMSPSQLADALRHLDRAVIGRIENDTFYLDLRTVKEAEETLIVDGLVELLGDEEEDA